MGHVERKSLRRSVSKSFSGILGALLVTLGLLSIAAVARASGPRWVTGAPYFTGQSGVPVVWYTLQPRYFTDPGNLSASVNHAAADAIVAAAAGVWNVPTAAITIAYGGPLAEHVSGADAYLSTSGPVFPSDTQASNYAAIQIAVVYDSDGSITDMLLGSGASGPAECRQNGVTEDVDSIAPSGLIQHAVLVLNGRCTGPAPEQQLQMQYQLERAFGRVLGIGWSQTNDNVFTRTPQPSTGQAQHWPIMHPIDIVCGAYTYECLPSPFTLRDDDLAAISGLYPMVVWGSVFPSNAPAPGKIWSYEQASQIYGTVSFPTGEGMQGVNVVLQRRQGGWNIPEAWQDVSAVSGALFQQNGGNPVTGPGSGMAASMGSTDAQWQGYYNMAWVPDMPYPGWDNGPMMGVVSTEAINPLYIGAYSVGAYGSGQVLPSGTSASQVTANPMQPLTFDWMAGEVYFAPVNAASNCNTSGDGVESAPQPAVASGWWNGVLCAHGHTAWSSFSSKAGRTATLEVTALDESGLATMQKAMPLIGVWAASDATGTLPTVASSPTSFNTVVVGMTATGVATTQATGLRFVIADARGDGRPDFAYQARVLYADSVLPAVTSANGGQVTISGMGFRAGNEVTINGVPAAVSNWTATAIVAVAPPLSAFGSKPSGPVDIEVIDLSSGGTTRMTGVLAYGNIAPDVMTLVSAPAGTIAVGAVAAVPFAVRVFLGDGVTPVVGLPMTFSVGMGSVQLGTCVTAPCVLLTDATGMASTTVMATAFGAVTLQASAVGATQTASFNAVARSITAMRPVEYVAVGATIAWTPQMNVVQNGTPAMGASVSWTASGGMEIAPGPSVVNAAGAAQIAATVGPLAAAAEATGQACVWATMCANFTAIGVDQAALRLVVITGSGQTVAMTGSFPPVVLMVTDGSGNPVAGATVAVHQTVDAAEMPCPVHGRCPTAPVLEASDVGAVSDVNGLVSVTPMQLAGVAEVTNIAAATGTQGFVSLSLAQGQ